LEPAGFVPIRRGVAIVFVPMELSRIIISELDDQQVVYLKECDGTRSFPILIGIFEAHSINRHVKGEESPRPLTHDLLRNAIEQMGGEIEDVVITNLEEHTYFAKIRVRQAGELIEIDSRPSDAIAVAVQFKPHLPILVDDSVLDQVGG
jgi:bifunctional DNase/RNase